MSEKMKMRSSSRHHPLQITNNNNILCIFRSRKHSRT